jgi:dihydrofolate reductase
MTKVIYYTATSLDGYIADPDDSLDWLLRQPQDEEGVGQTVFDYSTFIAGIGAIVMGSTTYRWIVDHQVEVREETGSVWPYTMPAWVLTSRDLTPVEGVDIRLARGDVRPVYEAMVAAADGKDVWVVGGGDLVGQFADAGLLDEVITTTAPVTLGAGRPLLPRRLELELVETARNAGFSCARYRVDGPLLEDRPA